METWYLILLMMLLSALFSGAEIALISANRLKIEVEKNKGFFHATIVSWLLKRQAQSIGSLLLGNNIALVIYGIAMQQILDPWLNTTLPPILNSALSLVVIQTTLSTLFILIFAEFLPKTLFQINPNGILRYLAFPLLAFYILIFPIVFIFIGLAEMILYKLLRIRVQPSSIRFTATDLNDYLQDIQQEPNDQDEINQEIQMVQNVIEFRSIKVNECMVPRPQIVALDKESSITTLSKTLTTTGHSKIIIYEKTIDNIIGYVHSHDLFKKPESIKEIIRPVLIIPYTMLARNLMRMFIQEHKSVAIAIDEFGGTSGMLTLEDVIEEIFGEIDDEFDKVDSKSLGETEPGVYILSGQDEIDNINEKYKLTLPESETYETLAGLILHYTEEIPKPGEKLHIEKYQFVIMKATTNRIDQVRITIET
ncbi:MAG: hemolysin family protein [Sphingobacteriia bacterium]|nr:hemolysin family protein [Sphingobacteriia bacterium]